MFLLVYILMAQDLDSKDIKECQDALLKHCPVLGKDLNDCIRKKFKELQKPCSVLWEDIIDPDMESLMNACQDDLFKYCNGKSDNKCIAANMKKFSKKCKKELDKSF